MRHYLGFELFVKAYRETHREIWVSVYLLTLITLVFATILYFAEHSACNDYTFGDALVWTFVKYVEDPADIASAPITLIGKITGTLVGVLGIAIFAVPAGLVGSGLMEAMDKDRREKELNVFYSRVCKAFRRGANKSLRTYLNTLPDKGGEAFSRLNFVPQRIPVTRLQVRQGMDLKDIFEVCSKYPNLSLKNLADAADNAADDQFVVEMFPKNRPYGCCIDRNSKVTIVCPTGFSEVGIGWYGYYLTKLGGFNYVCKNIEADPDELDSYYNMSDEPLFNKMKRSEYRKKDKEAQKMLDYKESLRTAFLGDIQTLTKKEKSWVIVLVNHQQSEENTFDFHFASAQKDGVRPTVQDSATYDALYQEFSTMVATEFSMTCTPQSVRYPLLKSSLAYRLQHEGMQCNTFVLRPSSQLVNFNEKKLVAALRAAQVISRQLDDGKGICTDDIEDFATPAFGFAENILKS